jgi:hypothetical protein
MPYSLWVNRRNEQHEVGKIYAGMRDARKAAQRFADEMKEPIAIYAQTKSGTVARSSKAYVRPKQNPGGRCNPVGHRVKGGRAITLHNFTGSVVRKSNGQVVIKGKAKKR